MSTGESGDTTKCNDFFVSDTQDPFSYPPENIDYRCEDRKIVGKLKGSIGAIR